MCSAVGKAQVLETYPYGQTFYKDGRKGLFREMVQIVKEKGISGCEDKKQYYELAVLVYPDSKIDLVKDFDTLKIAENKCSYVFAKALLPYLKNWIPAEIEGKKVKAIATFTAYPFFIYNSKINPEENIITPPTYSDGIENLEKKISTYLTKDIMRNTDMSSFVFFVINDKGRIEDAMINYAGSDAERVRNQASRLKTLSGDWAPATFNSKTFDWFMIVPLKASKKKYYPTPNRMYEHPFKYYENPIPQLKF